jgi:hypothetical protein
MTLTWTLIGSAAGHSRARPRVRPSAHRILTSRAPADQPPRRSPSIDRPGGRRWDDRRMADHCTPQRDFLGFRPDGRRLVFAEHVFYRYRDGRIAEVTSLIDRAAIAAQPAA